MAPFSIEGWYMNRSSCPEADLMAVSNGVDSMQVFAHLIELVSISLCIWQQPFCLLPFIFLPFLSETRGCPLLL